MCRAAGVAFNQVIVFVEEDKGLFMEWEDGHGEVVFIACGASFVVAFVVCFVDGAAASKHVGFDPDGLVGEVALVLPCFFGVF